MRSAAVLAVCLAAVGQAAFGLEGRRADSVLLNGAWEFALGEGNQEAYTAEGRASLEWEPVTLPGLFVPWSEGAASRIEFVWARRTFHVTAAQAGRLAVLRWDRIVHGATAFINGQKVGYNEPTGPYQVILPQGVLKAGQNEIVLLIAGGAGVRRSKSGHFLFPAGQIWGPSRPNMPALAKDIWIDFADRPSRASKARRCSKARRSSGSASRNTPSPQSCPRRQATGRCSSRSSTCGVTSSAQTPTTIRWPSRSC